MHDIKDVRKNPEKYRESQRARGLAPEVIDELLLLDAESRAYKTIEQELQSKLNKLTDQYGKAKHGGATPDELTWLEVDMEVAKIDAAIAKSETGIKYMEEKMWSVLGGREAANNLLK